MGQIITNYLNFRVCKHYSLVFAALFLFAFSGQSQVQVTVTASNINCFGSNTGSATAIGSGGWAPYTYAWSNGATTSTINGLAPGTYSVTVTDIDLGFGVGSVTITQPNNFGVLIHTDQPQLCSVAPDGKISAVPFGGVAPFIYSWSNGQATPVITGLSAGTYTVTITDAVGCTATGSGIILYNGEGIWLGDMTVNVKCAGQANGSISVMAMTGTPPYMYIWQGGQTTSTLTGLSAGQYRVTVTDLNGCSATRVMNVSAPPTLTATVTSTNANCGVTGTATVTPGGGTPTYSVSWSIGSNNTTISAMPGTYTVTVTDANLCTVTASITINGNSSSITVNTNLTSSAGCTIGGTATATGSGGSGNYSYSWDNGNTTASATNLTVGPHTVTITDVTTGCIGTGQVTVTAAPTLTVTATLLANATCLSPGSANATAVGGTAPYSYKWDNNALTATASLSAGVHSVTATDSKGCIATAMVTIGQSQGPSLSATVNTNATCTTGGNATVTATSGTGPYVYLWDNGVTTQTSANLSAGPHKVTVTDAAGCATIAMVTITQANAPTAIIANSTNTGCTTPNGSATVAATGGTTPYAYKWSNNATTAVIINLSAGTYTVTVTDAAGCTKSVSVSIASSLPPSVVICASANAKCDQPGSATACVTNGTGAYTYKWDNNETTATAVNLTAGAHSVTVTDAAGCTASASVNIGFSNNGVSIGDYVWYDSDQDGFQDDSETNGVNGVTVMLKKAGPDGLFGTADDITVQTKVTGANGKYKFECVTPGSYILMFTGIPSGFEFTIKDNVAGNDCKDSDVNTSTGKTSSFQVLAGQPENLCFDVGIHDDCDNVLNAGAICCDQTICEGQTPALLYGSLPPVGGSGAIQFQWLQLITFPSGPQWVGITGATGESYQPGPLFTTTSFMRCARRAGCTYFHETGAVTITVKPAGSPGCPNFIQDFVVAPGTGNTTTLLDWTTYPEADEFMYTVQYSVDIQNWQSIKTIMGNGDLTQPNKYEYEHQTPLSGKNFYRIKRTTKSNLVSFSDIRELDLTVSPIDALLITPNPVVDELLIKNIMQYTNDVTIDLVNTNGALLERKVIKAGEMMSDIINVRNLPSGLYFVRVDLGNGERKTLKVTKMK